MSHQHRRHTQGKGKVFPPAGIMHAQARCCLTRSSTHETKRRARGPRINGAQDKLTAKRCHEFGRLRRSKRLMLLLPGLPGAQGGQAARLLLLIQQLLQRHYLVR